MAHILPTHTKKTEAQNYQKECFFLLVKNRDESQMPVHVPFIMPSYYNLNTAVTVLTSNSGQKVKTKVSPVP